MRLVIKQLSADNTKEAQDTAGKTSLRVTQTQCPVGMLPAPAAPHSISSACLCLDIDSL